MRKKKKETAVARKQKRLKILADYVEKKVQEEREACAQLAETYYADILFVTQYTKAGISQAIAQAIRARK